MWRPCNFGTTEVGKKLKQHLVMLILFLFLSGVLTRSIVPPYHVRKMEPWKRVLPFGMWAVVSKVAYLDTSVHRYAATAMLRKWHCWTGLGWMDRRASYSKDYLLVGDYQYPSSELVMNSQPCIPLCCSSKVWDMAPSPNASKGQADRALLLSEDPDFVFRLI